jgi:hypothetical protein
MSNKDTYSKVREIFDPVFTDHFLEQPKYFVNELFKLTNYSENLAPERYLATSCSYSSAACSLHVNLSSRDQDAMLSLIVFPVVKSVRQTVRLDFYKLLEAANPQRSGSYYRQLLEEKGILAVLQDVAEILKDSAKTMPDFMSKTFIGFDEETVGKFTINS